MADNQETPDVSARDISELLSRFDATLGEFAKRLDGLEAQTGSNGEQLTKLHWLCGEVRDAVRPAPERDRDPLSAAGMLAEVLEHVREAAPLLQSRAVRAMRAGGSVIDYLKAGRS